MDFTENGWVKLDIFTSSEGVELLSDALTDLGHQSLLIKDAADLEKLMDGKYGAWDYIDPELMKLREAETTITLYIPGDSEAEWKEADIKEMLTKLKNSDTDGKLGRLDYRTTSIKDENWIDTWKDGYAPVIVGKKLIICPTWTELDPGDRKILKIDPGMAFGTGLDETTQLCLGALEKYVEKDYLVLDVGCGSGILSIAAKLLGAEFVMGLDISEDIVKVAQENAILNGVSEDVDFLCGSLGDYDPCEFDIVCANISADTILALIPEFKRFLMNDGYLILSGIPTDRHADVLNTLLSYRLTIIDGYNEKGWACIVATPALPGHYRKSGK